MKKGMLVFFLFFSFVAFLGAQQNQPRPVPLRFRLTAGERLSYTVQNDIDITETSSQEGGPERRAGSLSHSVDYAMSVENAGSDGVPSVLRLKVRRLTFKDGNPNHAFDSADAKQLAATKTRSGWAPWGAAISSAATVELMPNGSVGKFRLLEFDAEYGEQAAGTVNKMIEEITKYIGFPLPNEAVSPGQSWTGAVPVKFVGGPLGGSFFDLQCKFRLDRIGQSSGERVAWITVELATQPHLDVMETSIEGARVDFHVDHLEGTAVFSLDQGEIVQYNVSLGTHIQAVVQNQTIDDHKMEYHLQLQRTGSAR